MAPRPRQLEDGDAKAFPSGEHSKRRNKFTHKEGYWCPFLKLRGGGGVSALHATFTVTFTAGLPRMGWLLTPPKMPPKESKPLGITLV